MRHDRVLSGSGVRGEVSLPSCILIGRARLSLRRNETTYIAGLSGAQSWLIYGIIETFVLILLPWALTPPHLYNQFHLGFTALSFAVYGTAGFIFGALTAVLFRSLGQTDTGHRLVHHSLPRIPNSAGTVSLVAFYGLAHLQLLIPPIRWSEASGLVLSPLILAGLIFGDVGIPLLKHLRFAANPWAASILLVGTPEIMTQRLSQYSQLHRAAAGLALILLAYGFWRFQTRSAKHSTIRSVNQATRGLLQVGVCALIVLALSLPLRQTPLVTPSDLRSSTPGRPNIILLSLDTVRADHLSVYGYSRDTTPNLRRLAKEGTIYTQAISTGDMTLTAHASIFTGLYPDSHRAYFDVEHPMGRPLSDDIDTLAEIFAAQGYQTAAIVANTAFLSPDYGLAQGFAYYDSRSPVVLLGTAPDYSLRKILRDMFAYVSVPRQFDQEYRHAGQINAEVYSTLRSLRTQGKPFFLFVNYMDAHSPYIPPSPYDTLYPGKLSRFTSEQSAELFDAVMREQTTIPENLKAHLISQYDGSIRYLDAQIAEIITYLKTKHLWNDCLFIVTGDHGEAFGDRGLLEHGVSVYKNQVHVPLLIKYPIGGAGLVEPRSVSTADIFAVIRDVVRSSDGSQNQASGPLEEHVPADRVVVAASFPTPWLIGYGRAFQRIERAFYRGRYKLIIATSGKRELYDLALDPNETRSIYQERQDVAQELESISGRWLQQAVRFKRNPSRNVNQQTLDRLKSLGYVR